MSEIVLIDDDELARESTYSYLNRVMGYVVRQAGDIQTGWQLIQAAPPRLAIVDICLPKYPLDVSKPYGPHGLELAKRIKETYPTMGVVLSSAHYQYEQDVTVMAQKYGETITFLYRTGGFNNLRLAVEKVQNKNAALANVPSVHWYVLSTVLRAQLGDLERPYVEHAVTLINKLSEREKEIAHLSACSLTSDMIAVQMNLARGTIENNLTRIYQKLEISDVKDEAVPGLRPISLLTKAYQLYALQPAGNEMTTSPESSQEG